MSNPSIDAAFIEACENGYLSQLSDLLEKNPNHDISQISVDGGKSLLHLLAESNDAESEKRAQERESQLEVYNPMVALLIFGGCNINVTNHRGLTCLHVAAQRASSSFISTLLKRGADPSKLARGLQNVLHLAASNSSSDAWATLLAALPNPIPFLLAKNKSGFTPLHLCCFLGNAAGVTECSKYFCPLTIVPVDTSSFSPQLTSTASQSTVFLTDALRKKATVELLTTLFKYLPKSAVALMLDSPRFTHDTHPWPNGGSWLHYCAKRSSETSILALLKFGAHSFPDHSGLLPIHYCLKRRLSAASAILAERMSSSDWLTVDKKGRSLLHWITACAAPPPCVNVSLHSSVAYQNAIIFWNSFWTFITAHKPEKCNITILELLCTNPALAGLDPLGHTPFHLLAMRDMNGHGMDLLCKVMPPERMWSLTSHNKNVLHLASQNASPVVLHVLLSVLTDTVTDADRKKSIVNQKDTNGRTPLHLAIKASNASCIQHLLDHGANPKLKDKKGLTATLLAAKHKGLSALIQLADNGVCTYGEVVDALTCFGFRSSMSELESVKQNYLELAEQYRIASSSQTSLLQSPRSTGGHLSPRASRAAPNISVGIDGASPTYLADFGMRSSIGVPTSPTKLNSPLPRFSTFSALPSPFDSISEGERYPLRIQRSVSAPASEWAILPGRTSPRGPPSPSSPTRKSHTSKPSSSSSSNPNPLTSTSPPHSPLRSPKNPSPIPFSEIIRVPSFDSVKSTGMEEEGDIDEKQAQARALYINLESLPANIPAPNTPSSSGKLSRAMSTSPPKGGLSNWGPPSPTAATTPLSPHLSPRSISPHTGRTTPPGTPTSSGLDRMKLQRSLSPRSLPTIKENNPKDATAKEPSAKDKEGKKRHRSGSNSTLKKALLLRSRSLTKLPTNPGEDFLEQLKIDQGVMTARGGYTHHPCSLDNHLNSVLSHTKAKSITEQTLLIGSTEPRASSSSSPPSKKRHKSHGKSHHKTLSSSSEPSPRAE